MRKLHVTLDSIVDGPEDWVALDGSARLVRTLLGSGLVDELWLIVDFPDRRSS
jgi:hypothetical protein